MFTMVMNQSKVRDIWRVCFLDFIVAEEWSLCHQSDARGHPGVEGMLNKFFLQSTGQKIHFLNDGCDISLTEGMKHAGADGEACAFPYQEGGGETVHGPGIDV